MTLRSSSPNSFNSRRNAISWTATDQTFPDI
jgi:hypothetical protein